MKALNRIFPYLLFFCLSVLPSCAATLPYDQIPIPDRRMNMSGLVKVATHYLNEHPDDFHNFNRILTAADDALDHHDFLTRAGVMHWVQKTVLDEGYDEGMPVVHFLRTVYLEGWDRSLFNRVDRSEREYLYDLISAVMGGMHLCTTCSTAHEPRSASGNPDTGH